MHHLQPHQLKDYFDHPTELKMQEDIKSYFKGKIKPGTHLINAVYPGRLTDYYVCFLVEQPFNPRPFIIMVLVEATCNTSKRSFEKYCEKVLEKADELPERKAALMLNIQQQFG